MGDVSPHFSRWELACRCCGEYQIDQKLIDGLEMLRVLAGAPIHPNSGYRCEKHNASVGGSKSSQHRLGKAADIVISGLTPVQMYRLAEQVPVLHDGGIGIYPDRGFIHVDVRGHKVRWGVLGKKMIAIDEALKIDPTV